MLIIALDVEDKLLPVKVQFHDNEVPTADWFKTSDIYLTEAETTARLPESTKDSRKPTVTFADEVETKTKTMLS